MHHHMKIPCPEKQQKKHKTKTVNNSFCRKGLRSGEKSNPNAFPP